ncbi:MAG: FtsK/SpoIIIE domain-containing protein [Hyphomicrobium sp.]
MQIHARPYLLGPYLGIHPGDRFARLCLMRSVPSRGRLVIIQSGGPIDADVWRSHLPKINAWLGGAWAIADVAATAIRLIQRAELPKEIPMRREYLRNGALYLGFSTETQQPTYLPFSELSSGTFIVGAAGSGKSNATHLLMQSILANLHLFQAVLCVDGKEGMTFARYRNAAPAKLRILTDEPDLWKLTAQLVAITKARNATLARTGMDKAPSNYIAVVIEEMSTYTAKPATDNRAVIKAHGQFINDLAALARKGRSAGLKILITAQDPTAEQVPTSVRANCQTSIVFRLGIDQHATTMLGELTPTTDPRKLTTGRALLKRDNGTIITVQFPIMPEPGGRP